jgi:hypothetical protein
MNKKISPSRMQEKYAKLFDSALSREHIAALAALFGWEVPPLGQT